MMVLLPTRMFGRLLVSMLEEVYVHEHLHPYWSGHAHVCDGDGDGAYQFHLVCPWPKRGRKWILPGCQNNVKW